MPRPVTASTRAPAAAAAKPESTQTIMVWPHEDLATVSVVRWRPFSPPGLAIRPSQTEPGSPPHHSQPPSMRVRDWRMVCSCLWSRHPLQETTLRGLGMARPPPMLLGVSLHSSPGSPSFTRIPYQIGKLRQERENTCCLSLFTPAWEARRGCTHRKKIHLPIKLHECCDVNPPPSTNACSG